MYRRRPIAPRAAWIVCGAALLVGLAAAMVPTVVALSRPAERAHLVLYVTPADRAVMETHDDSEDSMSAAVKTRYGGQIIARSSFPMAENEQVPVALPKASCATPVFVRAHPPVPGKLRIVALTIPCGG